MFEGHIQDFQLTQHPKTQKIEMRAKAYRSLCSRDPPHHLETEKENYGVKSKDFSRKAG